MNRLTAVALLALVDVVAGGWWPWHHRGYTVTVVSTVTSTPTCFCPLETVITKTAACNTTSHPPTPTAGTGTRLSTPSPTCSLSALPSNFFLRTSNTTYLSVHGSSNRAINTPHLSNATAFHIRSHDDGSVTGIPQLATSALDAGEAGAWIQTSGTSYGSPIEFFGVLRPPQAGSGYAVVTAAFSTYLCRTALVTWMEHDLSYPLDCRGELWLGGGAEDGACAPVNVTVSTGID